MKQRWNRDKLLQNYFTERFEKLPTKFHFGVVREKHVLALDVSMDDFVGVEVRQTSEDLSTNVCYPLFFQTLSFGRCRRKQRKGNDTDQINLTGSTESGMTRTRTRSNSHLTRSVMEPAPQYSMTSWNKTKHRMKDRQRRTNSIHSIGAIFDILRLQFINQSRFKTQETNP
jgi:hypothetical protein